MTGPERIWICDHIGEYGQYYPNATEAEGEHGGKAHEYIRADLVQSLTQAARDLDRQFCDDDLGPSALAMGKLREAYMRLK